MKVYCSCSKEYILPKVKELLTPWSGIWIVNPHPLGTPKRIILSNIKNLKKGGRLTLHHYDTKKNEWAMYSF